MHNKIHKSVSRKKLQLCSHDPYDSVSILCKNNVLLCDIELIHCFAYLPLEREREREREREGEGER